MNINDRKYKQFALCNEMFEAVDVIRGWSEKHENKKHEFLQDNKRVLLCGEGSSRIFPATNVIHKSMLKPCDHYIMQEGALQAKQYPLDNYSVIGLSNSGRTNELVRLFKTLSKSKNQTTLAVTANTDHLFGDIANEVHVLACGKEYAVAATKSAIDQALCLESILLNYGKSEHEELKTLADDFSAVLNAYPKEEIIEMLSKAQTVYYVGENNGVAEELSLKTNEIIRKKSVFLKGTFVFHGIEEVVEENDLLVLVSPTREQEEKVKKIYQDGIGAKVIAITENKSLFSSFRVPYSTHFKEYLQLAAGWNLLVEAGINLKLDLDKTKRARKIGNEYKTS